MTILLNILVIWFLISIPVSLLAARVIKTRGMMYTTPAPAKLQVTVMKYHL